MNTEKGIVIHDMKGGITVSCPWVRNGKSVVIKDKDINECLVSVIQNARKSKRINEDPYKELGL